MTAPDRLDVLAHEIRSPVAALQAIAEAVAAGRPDPDRARRFVELAIAAVRNVERLLVDASFMSIELREVDVAAVVAEAVEGWRVAGNEVLLDASGPCPALVDPHRVRQAVDNLIGNGLGHSPADAPVTVTVAGSAAGVEIRVADRGEGIAPEDQRRMFEAGIRLTDARPGSGIGLAVVRAVAEAHGGEVAVESALGEGATFRLVLPYDAARPA
jgi:two-component system OmpR family sensor kinase